MARRTLALFLTLLLLLPLTFSAGSDETYDLGSVTTSHPTLELTFSEEVEITKAYLYQGAGDPIETFTDADFSGSGSTYSLPLSGLEQGDHMLSVEKYPTGNLAGSSWSHINFNVILYSPTFDISLASPRPLKNDNGKLVVGYSDQENYDLEFQTSEDATCQYWYATAPSTVLDFTTTGGTTHTITGLDSPGPAYIVVKCLSGTAEQQRRFEYGTTPEPPTIRLEIDPTHVTHQAQADVLFTVESPGQRVYCEAATDDYDSPFVQPFVTDPYDNTYNRSYNYTVNHTVNMEAPSAPVNYTFTVTCTNLGGIQNSTTTNVSVDYYSTRYIQRVAPDRYSKSATPTLIVKMVRGGYDVVSQECKYNATTALPDQEMAAGDERIEYSHDITESLADGQYRYTVECKDDFFNIVEGNVSFTVDTKPPHSDRVFETHDICLGGNFSGEVIVNTDNYDEDINFAGYNYSLWRVDNQGNYIYLVEREPSISTTFTRNLTSHERFRVNETYYWEIVPYDLAGWPAEHSMAATTKVWPVGSDECDSIPPEVTLDQEGEPARVIGTLNCTDDWTGCKRSFNYSKHRKGLGEDYCTYNLTAAINPAPGQPEPVGPLLSGLSDEIPFYNDQQLCWRVWDNNGNVDEQMVTVTLGDYLPSVNIITPDRYWPTKSVEFDAGIAVDDDFIKAQQCTVSPTQTFPPGGTEAPLTSNDAGLTWEGNVVVTQDADYIANVNCTTLEGKTLYKLHGFTVDSTPPANYEVVPLAEPTCADQDLQIEVRPKQHYPHDENFLQYRYTLKYGIGTAIIESGNSTTNVITYNGMLNPDEKYVWKVTVEDKAGHTQVLNPLTMNVVPSGDTACDYTAPTGSASSTPLYGGRWANVHCQDDTGCADSFNWDYLVEGSMEECDFTRKPSLTYSVQNESQELLFYDSGTFCFQVFDKAGNQYNSSIELTIDANGTDNTTNTTRLYCTNNELDLDKGETDVDCGGYCPACDAGSQCTFDSDCTTGICDALTGSCIPDTCNNNVTDGDETGVDCGGHCDGCEDGAECSNNEDCDSGFCNENSTCESVSCADNETNGYETDIDCGGTACSKCVEGQTCDGNSDCESGSCSDDGICESGDSPDSDDDGIPDDWEIRYGLDPNDPNDAHDDEDGDGYDNLYEYLHGMDPLVYDEDQEAGAGGFALWALILIILGLLLMGGSGYWLYYEHEERSATRPRSSPAAYRPRRQPLSAGQRTTLAKRGASTKPGTATRPAIGASATSHKRTGKKKAKRHSLTEGFDDVDTPEEDKPKPGDIPEKSPDDEAEKEEFISLEDLGKKTEEKQEATDVAAGKKKKDEDVFSDLDTIIDEKGGKKG